MDLSKLVTYSINEDGTWFDYPDNDGKPTGFSVKLLFLSQERIDELAKKATLIVKNRETKFRAQSQYHPELFSEGFAKACILEWEGLTPEMLTSLLPGADFGSGLKGDVDCTDINKIFLMRKSTEFANWVTGLVTEVAEHKKEQKEAETENLKNVSSGN